MPEPGPFWFATPLAQVDAIVPEVNAGEHDLLIAVRRQAGHLIQDLFREPAAQGGADVRDNAVAAVEQAAVLHLDERPLVLVKPGDAGGPENDAEWAEFVEDVFLVGDDPGDTRELADGLGVA